MKNAVTLPQNKYKSAERFMLADPSFTRRAGRLKSGEKALTPFLANTFGVSTRYVRALLNNKPDSESLSKSSKAKPSKAGTKDPAKEKQKLLKQMNKRVEQWINSPYLEQDKKLNTQLERLLTLVPDSQIKL